MRRTLAVLATLLPLSATAQEVGRYMVTPLPITQGGGHEALILDTKTGDLWRWANLPTSQGYFASALHFEGKMTCKTCQTGELVGIQPPPR